MSRLETHLARFREFRDAASATEADAVRVESWFLASYHAIEACAAKNRLHIQKHSRVPEELTRNLAIFGDRTREVVEAFRFLDLEARAKFVYGGSGTDADLRRARQSFEAIEAICTEALR
ncbi:MAG TPA: hypothetical protein VJ400_08470 [Thermoplasmata archaeon]|nr:hypothetical protein [Thermoplasmata archaeon]